MAASPAALAQAATQEKPEGLDLCSRFVFAGAVCCSVTHVPSLQPMSSRLGYSSTPSPKTVGAFKFGGYECFKQQSVGVLGLEKARQNRTAVYPVSAACTEFFASIALCPLEATRIRLVSELGFANCLIVTKFVVFENASVVFFARLDKSKLSGGAQTGVNLGSGLIAGFAAAIICQPADTMLSKINKTKGLPGESTVSRLVKIAGELGLRGSFAGLPTRLFMIGGPTAGQFAIYGDIKKALDLQVNDPLRTFQKFE
ncbi:mitochondrial carrier [Lepidopterella palustris CBS 459.81]|uniref:Mitochondrial carrier n=1 Tax=Lepidopterella palustris CBS 459.81 TaxID=1314670 RepID=A0A8E2J9E4_9PEZI|nr:mitochondrial carrier [Lepidopterella palustris CBS 459.81]